MPMRLPSFLAATPLPASMTIVPMQQVRTLPFTMDSQQQANWCWAATSKSVSHFYNGASAWTQCTIANAELNRTDCCTPAGASGPCNQYGYLDQALTVTGNLASPVVNGATAFTTVQGEVNGGRALGCRIGWFNGGGHFMVIFGWQVTAGTASYVDIGDPIYGNSHITYSAFCNNYRNAGAWTHSYFTKP